MNDLKNCLLLGSALLLLGCNLEKEFEKSQEDFAQKESGFTSFEDTSIPQNFDFKTSKEVSVELSVPDFLKNAVFGIGKITHEGDTINILRGSFDDNGGFRQTITINQTTDKLILNSEYMGLPDDVELPIVGGVVTLNIEDMFRRNTTASAVTKTGTDRIGFNQFQSGPFTYLDTYSSNGVPDNLAAPDAITEDFINDINATLVEGQNLMVQNPELLNTETSLALTDDADVWITFLGEGAGYRNALGYYTYPLGQEPQSVEDIEHKIIFPNTSLVGSGGGLIPGDKVHLGNFPANTVISWFIVANGWNGSEVNTDRVRYYSQQEFNPESTAEKRQHMVLLHDEARDRMILGFEDLNRDRFSDDDFNDVLFYTEVNPVNLDLSTIAKLNANPDSDGDGIIDALDEFPNDPNYAFTYSAPSGDTNGELGFEDLWPYRGDDDFNDMVVSYDYDIITNSDNQATRLVAYYTIKNIGGSFENAFAFTLPISPSLISNVSGQLINNNILNIASNGTELGTAQNESVIFVVGNALRQEGNSFTITVDFNSPIEVAALGQVPFNPFVVIQNDRAREVHLPNQPGTSKAQYFGEGADATNPEVGLYYTTFRNVPWVIDIYDEFQMVPETQKIYLVYPRFLYWANSNGELDQDWYLHPAEGYFNGPN